QDDGPVEFDVVGNSIDRINGNAVYADNEQKDPGNFGLRVFNNVFSNTAGAAVNLTTGPAATGPYITDGASNVEHATWAPDRLHGHSIGKPISVNPRFVNEVNGNLRLTSSSSLIDHGVTCSRGGVAGPDAARRSRIHGKNVDIGAFEFGAGPAGVVVVGT